MALHLHYHRFMNSSGVLIIVSVVLSSISTEGARTSKPISCHEFLVSPEMNRIAASAAQSLVKLKKIEFQLVDKRTTFTEEERRALNLDTNVDALTSDYRVTVSPGVFLMQVQCRLSNALVSSFTLDWPRAMTAYRYDRNASDFAAEPVEILKRLEHVLFRNQGQLTFGYMFRIRDNRQVILDIFGVEPCAELALEGEYVFPQRDRPLAQKNLSLRPVTQLWSLSNSR